MIASRTASEIWSQILSGWPSVTDSDVISHCGAVMNVVVILPPPCIRLSCLCLLRPLGICFPGRISPLPVYSQTKTPSTQDQTLSHPFSQAILGV